MRTSVDAAWAFERYQGIAARLPQAMFPAASKYVSNLGDVADSYDVFLFDSFGVLNVGETPIAGAAERLTALRAAGKRIFVLTNAASGPLRGNVAKYASLGFDFAADEIVSSREVLVAGLGAFASDICWGVAAPASSDLSELPCNSCRLEGAAFDECGGFILLSSSGWGAAEQERLADALARHPRPLLVGNPDLVAPREDSFSMEPGSFAHDLVDRLGIDPHFYGKPFGNAFDMVRGRLANGGAGLRGLMIGDTLHTDILGGAAAGFDTALVTGHGVMRSMDVDQCIRESKIVPDIILPTI